MSRRDRGWTQVQRKARIFLVMGQYQVYEIRSGRTVVGKREAVSAREAALDYLLARGCRRHEIAYYGSDGAVWRGAVYRALAHDLSASEGQQ